RRVVAGLGGAAEMAFEAARGRDGGILGVGHAERFSLLARRPPVESLFRVPGEPLPGRTVTGLAAHAVRAPGTAGLVRNVERVAVEALVGVPRVLGHPEPFRHRHRSRLVPPGPAPPRPAPAAPGGRPR